MSEKKKGKILDENERIKRKAKWIRILTIPILAVLFVILTGAAHFIDDLEDAKLGKTPVYKSYTSSYNVTESGVVTDTNKILDSAISQNEYISKQLEKEKQKLEEQGITGGELEELLFQKKLELLNIEITGDEISNAEIIWQLDKERFTKYKINDYHQLEYLLNAEFVSTAPYISSLGKDNANNGRVKFKRTLKNGDTIDLIYKNPEEFNSLVANCTSENDDVFKYFTVNEDGQVEVANYTKKISKFETNDENVVATDYDEKFKDSNEVVEFTCDKSTVYVDSIIPKRYTLNFAYLWSLLTITNDYDFVKELAQLAYDSEIEITLFDNEAETTTEKIKTYDIVTNITYEREELPPPEEVTQEVIDEYVFFDGERRLLEEVRNNYNWVKSTYRNVDTCKINGIDYYLQYNEDGSVKSLFYIDTQNRDGRHDIEIERERRSESVRPQIPIPNNTVQSHNNTKEVEQKEIKIIENETYCRITPQMTYADIWSILYEPEYYINENGKKFDWNGNNEPIGEPVEETEEDVELESSQEGPHLVIDNFEPCNEFKNTKVTQENIKTVTNTYSYNNGFIKRINENEITEKLEKDGFVNPKTNKKSETFVSLYLKYAYGDFSTTTWKWDMMEENDDSADMIDVTKYMINQVYDEDRFELPKNFSFKDFFQQKFSKLSGTYSSNMALIGYLSYKGEASSNNPLKKGDEDKETHIYKAFGKYQYDYRYELIGFINWCYCKDPVTYQKFEKFYPANAEQIESKNKEFCLIWDSIASESSDILLNDIEEYAYIQIWPSVKQAYEEIYNRDLESEHIALQNAIFSLCIREGKNSISLGRIVSNRNEKDPEKIIIELYNNESKRRAVPRWEKEKQDCLDILHDKNEEFNKIKAEVENSAPAGQEDYSGTTIGDESPIVILAKTKQGYPYVWGAKGPNAFDCSGLVYWVYTQSGFVDFPMSTEAYKKYINSSKEIKSWADAKAGDVLIIFQSERGSNAKSGHAAIYLGKDLYIHAPSEGDVVKIQEGARSNFTHIFRFQ